MKNNYLIIRHAETEGNVKKIHECRIDTPLTKNGIKEAINLAKSLSKWQEHNKISSIDKIYASPMLRVKKTLEILLKYVKLSPGFEKVNYTVALLEHNMGRYDGLTVDQVDSLNPGFTNRRAQDKWNIAPPEGENYEMVQKRVMRLIEIMEKRSDSDKTILIVGHKASSKILIGSLLKLNKLKISELSDLGVACAHYLDTELAQIFEVGK